MQVINTPKALIALVSVLCITVLLALGSIPSEAGVGMLGTIVGYAVGNGIAARAGHPADPILGPKERNP